MTKVQQTQKADRFNKLSARLEEIHSLYPHRDNKVMEEICQEISAELQTLHKELHTKNEYIFNFVHGGWNTIHAYTIEEAIADAQGIYDRDSYKGKPLAVDPESFRLKEKKEYMSLLASFY